MTSRPQPAVRKGLGPSGSLSPVRAARRVVLLLDALQEGPQGLTLAELAARTGMAKATTLRYLLTLEEHRYVERDAETGRYLLGLAIPSPAQFYSRLTRAARPAMERLGVAFEENVLLGVLDDDRIAFLEVVESPQVLRVATSRQDRSHIHSTALGKAIASAMPDDVVRRLLEWAGMPRMTERTITDPDRFLAELAVARERGYTVADRENDPHALGVAVPVPSSRLHLGLGITAPAMRFSLERLQPVVEALSREAQAVVAALTAESPPRAD